jgi:hypothetical protein
MMAWEPCAGCGREWYQHHAPRCSVAARKFVAEVARDKWAIAEDDPRCPHCGMECTDWTDSAPRNACDESEWSIFCPSCEREYMIELRIVYRFHIRQPKETIT